MIKLDEEFLAELGLGGLPPEDQKSLLAAIYEHLELTVGQRLAERMSDAELQEYEAILDSGDEEQASAWLQQHAPDSSEIVRELHNAQIEELRRRRNEILEAVGVDTEG